jgi:hypothetical protein
MEAVHGAEQYGWDTTFAKTSPEQNIIYSFTRNVVGPMDYTPVTFSSYPCCPHATSNAYELALAVLFESGITHFADAAENYLKTDSNVRAFLRAVPVTWDDTKYIQGYPGKDLVIARKKGDDWYIAGVNGENKEKPLELDLSFIPKGNYTFMTLTDGKTKNDIATRTVSYSGEGKFKMPLMPHGGFVIWARKGT